MNDADWTQMNFDPELSVNVHALISLMHGEVATLTENQRDEAEKCCADVMEQFLDLRREVKSLKDNLQFYSAKAFNLEVHFVQTNGREAYKAFNNAREKQN